MAHMSQGCLIIAPGEYNDVFLGSGMRLDVLAANNMEPRCWYY